MAAGGRTIRDFGEQWSHYGDNAGWYGSAELLQDVFGPLVELSELRGARAADVGSGTGRFARVLCEAGAERVLAVEPSGAARRLRDNTRDLAERVQVVRGRGEALPPGLDLDLVIAIGVVQFIPDPGPALRAARDALRPGGRLVVWVYGHENNAPYRLFAGALRLVTPGLPHRALAALCAGLDRCVDLYIAGCRVLPLPLHRYFLETFARLDRPKRRLVIYDQLNPSYVRYYRGPELRRLLEDAGFRDVRLHHRRGYSWTAVGTRP